MAINSLKTVLKRKLVDAMFAVRNSISKPNEDALFVFGFQKSGTTAIAGLLSENAGKSVTLDTKYLWPPYLEMLKLGTLTIDDLINNYRYPFSKDIIKEPNLTFFIEALSHIFSMEKYIFIVRNPFDNIRSVLNRLDIPGNQDFVSIKRIHPNWRHFFKSNGYNYVQDLARAWCAANAQKENIENDRCILVKYEDFLKDKVGFINQLTVDIGFELKKDISRRVGFQFQPKGNKQVDLCTFFGRKNYEIIAGESHDLLNYFSYSG